MEFAVRYWIAKAPVPYDGHRWDDEAWITHSLHPPTRLGLHNAILSAEDRLAVLHRLDETTPHGCDIFLVEGENAIILSVHEADELLVMVEHGEFSMDSFRRLLSTQNMPDEAEQASPPPPHHGGPHWVEPETPAIHRLDVDA